MYVYISDAEVTYLYILFFKVLINLSATANAPTICVEYISTSISYIHDFIDLF